MNLLEFLIRCVEERLALAIIDKEFADTEKLQKEVECKDDQSKKECTLRPADESDKCKHVNLLKELLDLEVPLNEILSSIQTSSILAPIKHHHEPQPKTTDSIETPKESADSLVLSGFAKISDKVNV
ncbi:hypothetical protein Tco_0400967 [Tanacetum coccineum]